MTRNREALIRQGATKPRCGGSGELIEQVSPSGIDHRDPAFETRETACPGCPDCAVEQMIGESQ